MRNLALLSIGLGLVAVSAAQTPGAAIRYAVVERCIQQLHNDGILIGYPESPFRIRKPPSRYEYAVAANASITQLEGRSRGLTELLWAPAFLDQNSAEARGAIESVTSTRDSAATSHTDIAITRFLFAVFGKELTDLGVDTAAASHVLNNIDARWTRFSKSPIPVPGSALESFSDIPANHWAANATKSLRRKGILTGYADGKFGG